MEGNICIDAWYSWLVFFFKGLLGTLGNGLVLILAPEHVRHARCITTRAYTFACPAGGRPANLAVSGGRPFTGESWCRAGELRLKECTHSRVPLGVARPIWQSLEVVH